MDPLKDASTDKEDLMLKISNRENGIRDYLDNLNKTEGRLYVTPNGPYSVLRDIENDFGLYRKTILRRCGSKRVGLSEWYVITGDTPLQVDEVCVYCDEVDDLLFGEGCWMTKVEHTHGEPLVDDDVIHYLFKGKEYTVTYGLLIDNKLPHLELKG